MEPLATTSEVIDALGGTAAVARLTGRSMQAVSNWKERGLFTAAAYEPISRALAAVGRAADPSVWKSLPPSALVSRARSASSPGAELPREAVCPDFVGLTGTDATEAA